MSNVLSSFDLASIPKTWRDMTMSPIIANSLISGLAAAAAYYGSPYIINKFVSIMPAESRAEIVRELSEPGVYDRIRKRLSLATGLAALLGTFSQTSSFKYPKSFYSWDWGIAKESQQIDGYGMDALMRLDNPLWDKPTVPIKHSEELIWNDRFIKPKDKDLLTSIFDNATNSDRSGLVSASQLAKGAAKLGFGYVGGSLVGNALGKIFSLPPSLTSSLSRTGGLANMLINSGVIGL